MWKLLPDALKIMSDISPYFVKRKFKKIKFLSSAGAKYAAFFGRFVSAFDVSLWFCSTFDVIFLLNFNAEEQGKLPQAYFCLFDRSESLETVQSDGDHA